MTTKIVFHGSDIEKICEYYHLNKEDIVKFGANVNPLGLSSKVRDALASNIDLFLPIRIEIILLFEIQFLNTAIFRLTLSSREMDPAS